MQKKDGKWFTRKKGAMLVLTLCLVGAAAATTYYAVDLSDTAQEPAKEHMVDLNESPVETEAEAVISSEAEANLASQANEMDVDPKSLAGGNRQIRAEQETAGQETEAETEGMETEKVSSGQVNAVVSPTVSFASTQELQWPVAGKVLMDYSMDSTVYFATLDQYKYNPALIFGAEEGAQVECSRSRRRCSRERTTFRIRGTADQILLQRRHKSIFCHGKRRSSRRSVSVSGII